ncbi:unnamed protein product [Arctia plantaginis]|uniref:Uncharacterized protein n=1 Tax=Arctia plantaginis TaxID=874455 RepID=A0A8S0ZGA8_ARCPL|nr:unnamed protein product [Arctia plantaginis]
MDSDSDSEPEMSKFLPINNEGEESSTDIIKLKRKGSSTDLINPNPKDLNFNDADDSLSEKIIMSSLPDSGHFKCSKTNSDLTDEQASGFNEKISSPKDIDYCKERVSEDNTEYSNSTTPMNMDNQSEISAKDLKLLEGKTTNDNDPLKGIKEAHCETVAIIKCAMQDILGKAFCKASLAACSAFTLIQRESSRMVDNFRNMLDEKTICPPPGKSNSSSSTNPCGKPKATQFDDCTCKRPKGCDNYIANLKEEHKSNNDGAKLDTSNTDCK